MAWSFAENPERFGDAILVAKENNEAEAEAIAAERYRKWCGCCGCKAALREVEDD